MKKKKCIALAMSAIMMAAALPIVNTYTPIISMNDIQAYADNKLQDGDKIIITKEEYDITQKTDYNAKCDRIDIYSSSLDDGGNPRIINAMTADDNKSFIDFRYDSSKGYILSVEKGAAGNYPEKINLYYLNTDGTWQNFATYGGKTHQMGEYEISLNRNTLGSYADIVGEDPVFTIEKKNNTGNYEFFCEQKSNSSPITVSGIEYQNYAWSVDVDYTIESSRMTARRTGKIYGRFLANKPYICNTELSTSFVKKKYSDDDAPAIDNLFIFDLEVPTTDDNGNIIYKSLKEIGHGDGYIIKNTEILKEVSAGDLDYGIPVIQNYDDDAATYFVKVAVDSSNKDYYFFKFNPDTYSWEFRVNTKDTPLYNSPVNMTEFPNEFAKGTLYSRDANDITSKDREEDSWTKTDFGMSNKTVTILTNNDNKIYTVMFDYDKRGQAYYEYVGIDPILTDTIGERAKYPNGFDDKLGSIKIPTNANADDVIHITGKESDGTVVDYTVKQKYDNDIIPVGTGDYTITDETTGLIGSISNGVPTPADEDGVLNIANPVIKSVYTIYDPSGNTVVAEGNLNGDVPASLNNLVTDTELPSKQIEWLNNYPYLKFDTESGILNSTSPDNVAKETSYFVLDTSDDAKKGDIIRINVTEVDGDVNQDGKFSIADLLMEQKYLLDTLDDKSPFGVSNYIAGDVCRDGVIDSFDMVILRQMIINK